MVAMLKKMQNDLQIMLTDPYAHVYCEKSYLCLLEKGESRELMTCMAVWRIKKRMERLNSPRKALIE